MYIYNKKNMKVIDNLISVRKIGFFFKKNLTKKMNKKKKKFNFSYLNIFLK